MSSLLPMSWTLAKSLFRGIMPCIARINDYSVVCNCSRCKATAYYLDSRRPYESEIDGPRGLFAEMNEALWEKNRDRNQENKVEEKENLRRMW